MKHQHRYRKTYILHTFASWKEVGGWSIGCDLKFIEYLVVELQAWLGKISCTHLFWEDLLSRLAFAYEFIPSLDLTVSKLVELLGGSSSFILLHSNPATTSLEKYIAFLQFYTTCQSIICVIPQTNIKKHLVKSSKQMFDREKILKAIYKGPIKWLEKGELQIEWKGRNIWV